MRNFDASEWVSCVCVCGWELLFISCAAYFVCKTQEQQQPDKYANKFIPWLFFNSFFHSFSMDLSFFLSTLLQWGQSEQPMAFAARSFNERTTTAILVVWWWAKKDFIMRGLHFHINWSVPRQKSIDAHALEEEATTPPASFSAPAIDR